MDWISIIVCLNDSREACSIRVLDTVFINPSGQLEWYYTTKAGILAKKKSNKTTVDEISNRFVKFALANPNNIDKIIGVVYNRFGERTLLAKQQFDSFLTNDLYNLDSMKFLQVYLRPQNGNPHSVISKYKCVNGDEDLDISISQNGKHVEMNGYPNIEFIRSQISVFTNNLINSLSVTKKNSLRVTSLTSEYIIDDNNHIWLSHVSQVEYANNDADDNSPSNKIDDNEDNNALPDIPPRTTSSQARKSNNTANKVIYKEGSILKCDVGPDDLPGLKAWVLQRVETSSKFGIGEIDQNKWSVDLTLYNDRISNVSNDTVRRHRASMVCNVSGDIAAILLNCQDLLCGNIPIDNAENFQKKWREIYRRALNSDTNRRSSNMVQVCGNCDAICAKISNLISTNFDMVKLNVNSPKRDMNTNTIQGSLMEDSTSRGNSRDGSRVTPRSFGGESSITHETTRNTIQVDNSTKPRVKSSNGMHVQSSLKAYEESKVNNTSTTPTTNSKVISKKSKNKASSAGTKKHVTNDTPNMTLLAKFAAEREKQKRYMEAENDVYDQQNPHDDTAWNNGDNDDEYEEFSIQRTNMSDKQFKKSDSKVKDKKIPAGNNPKSKALAQLNDGQRLYELERIAAMNINTGDYNNTRGFKDTSFTGSEESFMLRQASVGDTSQISQFGNTEFHGTPKVIQKNIKQSKSSVDLQITQTINERIETLEKQVRSQSETINRKDIELSKMDQKYSKLNQEYIEFKNTSKRERDSLIAKYDNEILSLKESFAMKQANNVMNEIKTPRSPTKQYSENSSTAAAPAMTSLLEQIDILQLELRKITDKSINEKKIIQNECAAKLHASEQKYTKEMQSQRNTIVALEDRVDKIMDELRKSQDKNASYTSQIQVLEAERAENVAALQRARTDLKSMQQSVASTYRLESTQGIGLGVDADTAIKLNDAKYEAKNRQLANQVEFLKSQLAAELASVEEMRKVCDSAKEKAELMKAEYKERMAEAERIRVRDINAAELRVEQRYEARMTEFTSLQSKFLMVQNQIQETLHDSEIAKQREELAKNASSKAQAQIALLREEVEQLRHQLSDLRDKSDVAGTDNEVSKHSQESMLRRLDNERQYLKSQLTSEITLKNELQQTLAHCQKQLADIQRQWTEDVDTLNEQKRITEEETLRIEQNLTRNIATLKSELHGLGEQNEQLKTAFVKVRDQLRSEQNLVQNERNVINSLTAELKSAKEDLENFRNIENRNIELYRNQLEAVKISLAEVELQKQKDIQSMKEEMARIYLGQCDAQKESMVLRHEFEDEKRYLEKLRGALRLFIGVKNWRVARISHYFKIWIRNIALGIAASQFREKLNSTVRKLTDQHETEKDRAIEKLTAAANTELENKLATLKMELKWEMESALLDANTKLIETQEQNKKDIELACLERDQFWDIKMNKLIESHEEEKTKMKEQMHIQCDELKIKYKNDLQSHVAKIEEKSYNEKLDLANSVAVEWDGKLKKQVDDVRKEYELKIQDIESNHKALMAIKLVDWNKEKQIEIANIISDYKAKELEMMEDHAFDMDSLKKQYVTNHEIALANYKEDLEKQLNECRLQCDVMYNEKLKAQEDIWYNETMSKLNAKDGEIKMLIEQETSLLQKNAIDAKLKAVKLETSKWQQVLKEAEKKYTLEIQQARAIGYTECEKKKNYELTSLTENHQREMLISNERHRESVAELVLTHEQQIEKLKSEHEDYVKQSLKNAEAELLQRVEIEYKKLTEERVLAGRNEEKAYWEPKFLKEQTSLERMRADLNRQLLNQAEERRQLLEKIEGLENKVAHNDARLADTVRTMKEELELERTLNEANRAKLKKVVIMEEANKHDDEMAAAQKAWEKETLIRIENAQEKLRETFREQIDEMQSENDKLISGLENALNELKMQKVALSDQLEQVTTKLEHAEDSLYDSLETIKSLNRKNGFTVWRNVVVCMRISHAYQSEIQRKVEESKGRIADYEVDAKVKMSEVIMIGMRLSNLIVLADKYREKIYSTLTSYKSMVLVEKRTQIKMLEQELTRIAEERDALEDNQDKMEDEVADLEGQIRDLEDQMRDHNRTSSVMQNGRINASHARKKKRIDTDLERILDLVEQKRSQITEMNDKVLQLNEQKDRKESQLIDMERELVQILIEQQRMILGIADEMKSVEEKGKVIVRMSRLPWPPPENPSTLDIEKCLT